MTAHPSGTDPALLVTCFGSPLVALTAVSGVSRPNPLIHSAPGVSAGIANDFNEMRVLFSINSCTMPQ
jgi:hypothetical protein